MVKITLMLMILTFVTGCEAWIGTGHHNGLMGIELGDANSPNVIKPTVTTQHTTIPVV